MTIGHKLRISDPSKKKTDQSAVDFKQKKNRIFLQTALNNSAK